MMLYVNFKFAIALTQLAFQCPAYALDKSCQSQDATNVKEASAEAIKVLQYAQDRIRWQFANNVPDPYGGTLMQDMMGDDGPTTSGNAKAWFGIAVNNLGPYSDTEDGKVLIYCGDAHLTSINVNTGQFRDTSRPGTTFTLNPGMQTACAHPFQALGYPIFTDPRKGSGKPYYAIVLCSPALNSATISLETTIHGDRTIEGLAVMGPAQTLTGKILHEFMHVAGPEQFPLRLPDGSPEVYFYDNIAKKDDQGHYVMSQNNKRYNADSFALVATALYARFHYVEDGRFKRLPEGLEVPANIASDVGPQPGQASAGDSPADSGPNTPPDHRIRGLGRPLRFSRVE